MPATQSVHKPRVKTLDSLRGIAALIVLLGHLLGGIISYKIIGGYSPIHFLTAGYEAVIFFFLLSGYVLVYQYESNPHYTYGRFLMNRFFRIYIPYIVSIFLCIAVYFYLNRHEATGSAWIGTLWRQPLTYTTIIDHVILINNFNTNIINPVIWSLVHEMRIALIFPVVLFLVRWRPVYTLFTLLIISITSTLIDVYDLNPSAGYFNSYSYTLRFFYIFVVGGLIAKHQVALLNNYNRLKDSQKITIFIIATFILNYAHLMVRALKRLHLPAPINYLGITQFNIFLITLVSCFFIIGAINIAHKKTILLTKAPLFLGKISYSLYLVHIPVIGLIYAELNGKLPIGLILLISLILSFVIATIFYKYVEDGALKWQIKVISPSVNKSTS